MGIDWKCRESVTGADPNRRRGKKTELLAGPFCFAHVELAWMAPYPYNTVTKDIEPMKNLMCIGIAFGLMACGGGNPMETAATENPCTTENPCETDNPCGENPCGGRSAPGPTDVGVDWSGWESWVQVNAEPFVSKGHKKPWVNVYVPAEHAEIYAARSGEMPEGFAIVKSVHDDAAGAAGDVAMLTVMAKMGRDYDPDNGNWYYGVLSKDGRSAVKEGKIETCIDCHSAGKDYLFGTK